MANKIDKEFGRRVASLREGTGFTQKEAARKIGVSYSTYQRYESGGLPSKRNVDKLIAFYKCNDAWLIYGEGKTYTNRRWDAKSQIERLKGFCHIDADEEFASLLGVHKKVINNIRNNNDDIPDSWFLKISKETDISYDRLCFGVGPKHRSDYERDLHDPQLDNEEMVSSIDILPIDEGWIQQIVVRLEDSLEKMNRSLSPTWKAFVIITSYESFWYHNNKTADLKIVDSCLRMALKGEKDISKK